MTEREQLDLLAAADGDSNWRGAATARTQKERLFLCLFRQLPEVEKAAVAELLRARMRAIKPPH